MIYGDFMAKRKGRNVIEFDSPVYISSSAAIAGKTEGEGPLAREFDIVCEDDGIGQSSWENAEAELIYRAVNKAIEKAGLTENDVSLITAGDLLNQCTASTYGVRGMNIPFAGLFGACSTMAFSLALSSVLTDGGAFENTVCAVSSHFCSAEKQFRYPLEYGGQRSPTAQRTVTGGAAAVINKNNSINVGIRRVMFGTITDLGITDSANMGAAMAPAAARTVFSFLEDINAKPDDFDMILTGDLGFTGSELLRKLAVSRYSVDISAVHNDCGMMIFDRERQDVHSGGSGCACSGLVLCSDIINRIRRGELKRVLFAGTGALMSPLVSLQGESIPGIAHAVELSFEGEIS